MPAFSNSDINFAPQKSPSSGALDSSIKAGNKLFISVTIIILIISSVVYYLNHKTRVQIETVRANIEQAENDIDKLKTLGKEGYKLGVRLKNAEQTIIQRTYLSRVLEALKTKLPAGISLKEIRMEESGSLTFIGYAEPNYTPVTTYRANLLDSTKDKYFSDVKVTSSNFNKSTGKIEFTLLISLNAEYANGPGK
ncbi:MAG: hypothetical protein E6Q58_00755 [Niabella sp.]|nr:MAG: hypothetical protein E6Q58_00755 [Niabella sp.]